MVATNSYTTLDGSSAETRRVRSANGENMEINDTPWFNGILKEDSSVMQENMVKVVDNGHSIEFVLPQGTAQFAEMFVHDTDGKIVWKTQSFNQRSILWHKQTIYGGRVPGGRYTFRMKQSNRQIYGAVDVVRPL